MVLVIQQLSFFLASSKLLLEILLLTRWAWACRSQPGSCETECLVMNADHALCNRTLVFQSNMCVRCPHMAQYRDWDQLFLDWPWSQQWKVKLCLKSKRASLSIIVTTKANWIVSLRQRKSCLNGCLWLLDSAYFPTDSSGADLLSQEFRISLPWGSQDKTIWKWIN